MQGQDDLIDEVSDPEESAVEHLPCSKLGMPDEVQGEVLPQSQDAVAADEESRLLDACDANEEPGKHDLLSLKPSLPLALHVEEHTDKNSVLTGSEICGSLQKKKQALRQRRQMLMLTPVTHKTCP